MLNIRELVDQIPVEHRIYHEWQFYLAQRLCQIMEAENISQPDFARMVGITEEELDDLIHMCTDPSLSLLARIAALSKSDVLIWVNTDVKAHA